MPKKLLLSDKDFIDKFDEYKKDPDGVEIITTMATKIISEQLNEREILFRISDKSLDRDNDTINPKGWKLENYKKNPVVLWGHDTGAPSIGKAKQTFTEDNSLVQLVEFMPEDLAEHEHVKFSYMIYQMVKNGFLNATSVGFLPVEYKMNEDKERGYGFDFLEQELYENSIVTVPSNPNAIAVARSKGIDTRPYIQWAEKELDEGTNIIVDKKHLEAVYKVSKDATQVQVKKEIEPETEVTEETTVETDTTTEEESNSMEALLNNLVSQVQSLKDEIESLRSTEPSSEEVEIERTVEQIAAEESTNEETEVDEFILIGSDGDEMTITVDDEKSLDSSNSDDAEDLIIVKFTRDEYAKMINLLAQIKS